MKTADIKPGDLVMVECGGGMTMQATVVDAPADGQVRVAFGDLRTVHIRNLKPVEAYR